MKWCDRAWSQQGLHTSNIQTDNVEWAKVLKFSIMFVPLVCTLCSWVLCPLINWISDIDPPHCHDLSSSLLMTWEESKYDRWCNETDKSNPDTQAHRELTRTFKCMYDPMTQFNSEHFFLLRYRESKHSPASLQALPWLILLIISWKSVI